MSLDLSQIEAIPLPGATVYVLKSDVQQSIGFLRLDPLGSLAKHNRPVEEWLVQIEGTSTMKLFDNDEVIKEVTLKRGDSLRIPASQYHQHTNQETTQSLTSWHFDGDITEVIEEQRKNSRQ
jgi:mannose-6-phosphate isomerase-like protein (cupin superfamily)